MANHCTDNVWIIVISLLISTCIHSAENGACSEYEVFENVYMDISTCGTDFSYNSTLSDCTGACTADENCISFNYYSFIPGCLLLNCFDITTFSSMPEAKAYIKCSALEEGSDSGSSISMVSPTCFPNGTIAFENPDTIIFSDVMAIQFEGSSSATKCTTSSTASWIFITGCDITLEINVFFSNRSATDGNIFGGVPGTTRSYVIQCDVPDHMNRTVANVLGVSVERTTLDAITPTFTVTTDLRTTSATGTIVNSAVVGDTLYWTIDIPAEYNGLPSCTAYSGTSSSGTPSSLLVSNGCAAEPIVVADDFDNEITSIPGIKRLWTTIYAFTYYNSNDIYFLCTVKVCPSSSTSCDIACGRKRRNVKDYSSNEDHSFSEDMIFTASNQLHLLTSGGNAAPAALGGIWLFVGVMQYVI